MSSPLRTDVLVVGAGLGGCAAALAAAQHGARVVLVGDGNRVGGQVSAQLVSALDEHATVEQFPGTAAYGDLRSRLRGASGGDANPGGGWVSRLCCHPAVAESVLRGLLAQAGVAVLTGTPVTTVSVAGGAIRSVLLAHGAEVVASVVLDATELGDLLPLAGVPYVTGSEGPVHAEEHALPAADPRAMQSFTWCAALEHVPGARFDPVARPPSYDRWRHLYSFAVRGWDGTPHRYRMFDDGPDGRPPFWTYRRLTRDPDRITLNWVSNDYAGTTLVHDRATAERESREQTLGFVHWLQTEAPHDDGAGHGFAGLRLDPALSGTADGLAAEPYVRESRRLLVRRPVSANDLAPVPGRARAAAAEAAVAVAHYHADLHPRVGAPTTVYAATAPFQLPLRALVAGAPGNLVMAGKGIGGTQVAAAAYRVHSGEWAIGEAAGTLAAVCVRRRQTPVAVRDAADGPATVQRALVTRGAAIAWINDVPPSDPLFAPSQLLVAAGALAGEREETLDVLPDRRVDDRDRRALHVAAHIVAGDRVQPPPSRPHDTWRDLVRHYATALGLESPATPQSALTPDRSQP